MSAIIIDGKATAERIRAEITVKVNAAAAAGLRRPGLGVLLVGENPASVVYVRNKRRACEEAGFHSIQIDLPTGVSQSELLDQVTRLNADPAIDGILCQFPLPTGLDEHSIINAIDPDKDVDGLNPVNAGRLASGVPGFVPCTPVGCMELLRRHGIATEGKRAVVLGRSRLVGMPMALLLMARGADATVTLCHSKTRDLAAECARADILIAAIGRPKMVTADFVKQGAAVIDVGINRIDDPATKTGTRLVGDVDFEAVKEKAGWITPVPGGVGPMTIAMLLANTYESWKKRK